MSLAKCIEILSRYYQSFLLGIRTTLIVSISGTLITLNAERKGSYGKDEVLFVIADMESGFYIECQVPKSEAQNMSPGMEVRTDVSENSRVERGAGLVELREDRAIDAVEPNRGARRTRDL